MQRAFNPNDYCLLISLAFHILLLHAIFSFKLYRVSSFNLASESGYIFNGQLQSKYITFGLYEIINWIEIVEHLY